MKVEGTRLSRAIGVLKGALGTRPFVLVVERAHKEAPKSRLTFHVNDDASLWQVIGLLRAGTVVAERQFAERDEDCP